MLRALLAGLFVFASMLGSVILIGAIHDDGSWPTWATFAPILIMIVAVTIALQFFNPKGQRLSDSRMSAKEKIKALEKAGLVEHAKYAANRCFGVEESEDEGPHYYIELRTGGVLYLTGQYLYDYEAITDDAELNQSRRFPCADFEILRHKKEKYVLSILCSGAVLRPEAIAPPFSKTDWKSGVPEDGDVITSKTYEALKTERLARR